MSLDWNIADVADHHLLHNTAREGEERPFPEGSDEDRAGDAQWQITNSLIWATMTIGMNKITVQNVDAFYDRLWVKENVIGCSLRKRNGADDGWVDLPITYADVKRRIGLSTNADRRTNAQFQKRMFIRLEEKADGHRRRQIRDAAKVEDEVTA